MFTYIPSTQKSVDVFYIIFKYHPRIKGSRIAKVFDTVHKFYKYGDF